MIKINTSTFLYDFLNFIIFPDHCVKLFLKGYTQMVCKAVKSVFFEDYRLNIVGFVTHCPFPQKLCFLVSIDFYGRFTVFIDLCLKEGGRGRRGGGSKGLNTPLVIHLPTSLIQHNAQGCSYWA